MCASNVFGDRNKYLSNTFTGNGIEQLVGIVDKQGCLGIESSTQVTVKNNIFTNNASAFGIASGFGPTPVPGGLDHDIDDSNTVNGKKIYYLKGLTNTVINPQTHPDAAAIYCVFCDGVTIEDFVFDSPNSQAVLLGETINSVVRGIFALNYDQGIALDSAANNLITENTVLNQEENFFVFGMTGIRCQGNTITGNSFTSETPAWNFLDLIIDCDDNTIGGNTISGSAAAAIRVSGDNNVIEDNSITNSAIGVELTLLGTTTDSNIIRYNDVTGGRFALWPFGPGGRQFPDDEVGIRVGAGATNTVVTRNIVKNMIGESLIIRDDINARVSQNDFLGNANNVDLDGTPNAEVKVDFPIGLSVDGIGNYWGRNCGLGNENGPPLFQPTIDSNSSDVVDSLPFDHSVARIPITEPLNPMPCPTP